MLTLHKDIVLAVLLGLGLLASCNKNGNGSAQSMSNLVITSPGQPLNGYGGAAHAYTSVIKRDFNDGLTGFMLYSPATPHADSLPVIVFLHGFGEWNPINYGAWINHLILRGNLVIFPIFQNSLDVPSSANVFTVNVVAACQRAIDTLHAHPDWTQPMTGKICIVGHSYGGVMSADMAEHHVSYNLPKPLAFMAVAPGTGNPADQPPPAFDPSIYMLTVVEGDDQVVGPAFGQALNHAAANVPSDHRNLIEQFHDAHGKLPLTAVHGECWGVDSSYDNGVTNYIIDYANSNSVVNTVDYYCYWKLFDALQDCALNGSGCATAFGNTHAQIYMGKWSDSTAVVPLGVTQ